MNPYRISTNLPAATRRQRTLRTGRLLCAPVAASVLLAACGSSSSTNHVRSSPSPAASSVAHPATSSTVAGGSGSLTDLNAKLKHLTPAQLAQIKARLPLYMKTVQRCERSIGNNQGAILDCLHQHGF